MKTLRTGLFGLLALTTITAKSQSVDDIVSKYINALGGKEALAKVKTVTIESAVSVMGNEVPSKTYIVSGKGYKNETDFNGTKIIQCVTDKGGWMVNPMAGATTPTALPAEQLKSAQSQFSIGGPLVDYATKGYKVELAGKDTADYQLHVTSAAEGFDATFFINQKNYLLDKLVSKSSVQGQSVETTIHFSDYRKTDVGYVMPYAQKLDLPQFSLDITHKKIDINQPIDAAIFDMPKS